MKTEKGFTLIELLVVISIIGVLAGLASFNFQQARERSRDVQRKSDMKQIQTALEVYKNDQRIQAYPDSDTWQDDLVDGEYMKAVPSDPREQRADGSWVEYSYTLDVGDSLEYTLITCLENDSDVAKDGTNDDVTCDQGWSYTLTQP